ncbi:MAG TPA: hypothetical protein VFG45_04590 [Candidatus Nitrosocosmicus sp.]|nr:hypothetical protein [Candidatus Nitrosocosmicus sp.]
MTFCSSVDSCRFFKELSSILEFMDVIKRSLQESNLDEADKMLRLFLGHSLVLLIQ